MVSNHIFVPVTIVTKFSSVAQSCPNVCDPMDCSIPGFPVSITNSWSLLKLMSIESVMPSSHLSLCRPLLLLPSIFPSIRVFSNESVLCIRWPKYWSLSFSISPSSKYSGLISFRIDWFDLAVQGTLKEPSPTPQFKSINHYQRNFKNCYNVLRWKSMSLSVFLKNCSPALLGAVTTACTISVSVRKASHSVLPSHCPRLLSCVPVPWNSIGLFQISLF